MYAKFLNDSKSRDVLVPTLIAVGALLLLGLTCDRPWVSMNKPALESSEATITVAKHLLFNQARNGIRERNSPSVPDIYRTAAAAQTTYITRKRIEGETVMCSAYLLGNRHGLNAQRRHQLSGHCHEAPHHATDHQPKQLFPALIFNYCAHFVTKNTSVDLSAVNCGDLHKNKSVLALTEISLINET